MNKKYLKDLYIDTIGFRYKILRRILDLHIILILTGFKKMQ